MALQIIADLDGPLICANIELILKVHIEQSILAVQGGWATLSRLFVDEGTQLDDTTAVR
jgi:hypothetical protein